MLVKQQISERHDRVKATPLKILKQPDVDLYDYGTGAFGYAGDGGRLNFGIRRSSHKRTYFLAGALRQVSRSDRTMFVAI
jgi:hypothetical protein